MVDDMTAHRAMVCSLHSISWSVEAGWLETWASLAWCLLSQDSGLDGRLVTESMVFAHGIPSLGPLLLVGWRLGHGLTWCFLSQDFSTDGRRDNTGPWSAHGIPPHGPLQLEGWRLGLGLAGCFFLKLFGIGV